MQNQPTWRTTETLAFTEHDGPERPPRGASPILGFALAGVLAVVFSGMVFADTLCPEHRAWVQALGSVALVGCVASAIALIRGWAVAPVFAIGTTLIGVVIGLIDATHDGTRGALVASCFAVAAVGAAWLGLRQLSVQRWQREQVRRSTAGLGPVRPIADVDIVATADEAGTPGAANGARSDVTVR